MNPSSARPPLYLLGLIGRDIQGSVSPRLHEAQARRLGLRCSYALVDFAERGWDESRLPEVLTAMQTLGYAGCNVTHPYKQAIMPYLDSLSPEAEALGTVNTVVFKDGRRIGYNTDCSGFCDNFQHFLRGASTGQVLQVGAGGAGFAVAHGMLQLGTGSLWIYDRDTERSEALVARLAGQFGAARVSLCRNPEAALVKCDGLVQATPVGMLGHPGMPVDPQLLHPEQWLAEVIYVPLETELLLAAKARGCRTMNGGGMVVFQAAGAFEHFTGIKPDAQAMLEDFAELMK